ncbi:MAG: TIGR01777 family protein [Candidatus Omnitrophica bacterium]|nr:TIGR01777 family protein [Candidatus Omnitrophota bacterium]
MKLLVTGGTGFIGSTLCQTLAQHGHDLLVVSRSPHPPQPNRRVISWDDVERQGMLGEMDGVVHLAGESIAGKPWTPKQKALIRDSRVQTTRRLVRTMAASVKKPAVLVSASAVGYYGPRGEEPLTESDPPGEGFLAQVCREWEGEAQQAEGLGIRVVRLRLGIVLAPAGGALAKMAPPFRAFVGGPLGSGRQWMSWIHREDVIGLIEWSLTHPDCAGAINATAPNPVTMREFCRALGQALRRPSWAPVPAPVLRLLLGEMAQMLLTGQRVIPQGARRAGYAFRYPDLADALAVCV